MCALHKVRSALWALVGGLSQAVTDALVLWGTSPGETICTKPIPAPKTAPLFQPGSGVTRITGHRIKVQGLGGRGGGGGGATGPRNRNTLLGGFPRSLLHLPMCQATHPKLKPRGQWSGPQRSQGDAGTPHPELAAPWKAREGGKPTKRGGLVCCTEQTSRRTFVPVPSSFPHGHGGSSYGPCLCPRQPQEFCFRPTPPDISPRRR